MAITAIVLNDLEDRFSHKPNDGCGVLSRVQLWLAITCLAIRGRNGCQPLEKIRTFARLEDVGVRLKDGLAEAQVCRGDCGIASCTIDELLASLRVQGALYWIRGLGAQST